MVFLVPFVKRLFRLFSKQLFARSGFVIKEILFHKIAVRHFCRQAVVAAVRIGDNPRPRFFRRNSPGINQNRVGISVNLADFCQFALGRHIDRVEFGFQLVGIAELRLFDQQVVALNQGLHLIVLQVLKFLNIVFHLIFAGGVKAFRLRLQELCRRHTRN